MGLGLGGSGLPRIAEPWRASKLNLATYAERATLWLGTRRPLRD